jgi:DNA segregation ATPase FtsK/SpoIIIE, S-DNA-T family
VFDALEPIAHTFGVGTDAAALDEALADLRRLQVDMDRRYATIRALPREEAPETKTTSELASRKSLKLHPVVVIVDEIHLWFGTKELLKTFGPIVEDLVRRGPAVGIILWMSTQRPDGKSIPTAITSSVGRRICLRVTGYQANDMILGDGMWSAGYRASQFSNNDKGVAYVVSEDSPEPVVTRLAYLDAPAADPIVARARAAREATGWLTGRCAGEEPPAPEDVPSILDHILDIWPPDTDRLWHDDIAGLLAKAMATAYAGWTGRQVSSALRPYDFPRVQIRRGESNKLGLTHDDLLERLADHHLSHAPDDDGQEDSADTDGSPT